MTVGSDPGRERRTAVTRRTSMGIIAGGLLLLVGLMALFLVLGFERRTRQVSTGYGGRARENDCLAAGWILEELGLEVTFSGSIEAVTNLSGHGGTLILAGSGLVLSRAQEEALIEWVSAGGSLVIVAETEGGGSPDPDSRSFQRRLMDRFGIVAVRTESASTGHGSGPLDVEPLSLYDPRKEGAGSSVTVDMDRSVVLRDPDLRAFWRTPDTRSMMMHVRLGSGMVTVLSDHRFMLNRWVGERTDNARLLWYLATVDGRRGRVVVASGRDYPSLVRIAVRRGWTVLISVAALLAVVIGMVAPRLGPIDRVEHSTRRSLLEHLDAVGRFHWRQGHRELLVDRVRRAVRARVRRRNPSWERLSPQAKRERLRLLLGPQGERLGHVSAHLALTDAADTPRGRGKMSERRFVETVAMLETIRRSL